MSEDLKEFLLVLVAISSRFSQGLPRVRCGLEYRAVRNTIYARPGPARAANLGIFL